MQLYCARIIQNSIHQIVSIFLGPCMAMLHMEPLPLSACTLLAWYPQKDALRSWPNPGRDNFSIRSGLASTAGFEATGFSPQKHLEHGQSDFLG